MAEVYLEIETKKVLRVTEVLCEHLKSVGYKTVKIPASYYWHIDREEVYEPLKDPKELDMGDLYHDWERLEQILEDTSGTVTFAFCWLGAIMRAIGDFTEG